MDMAFPPDDEVIDPCWWAPIEAVAAVVASDGRFRFFDIDDFMQMGKVVRRKPRPDILLYKHIYTRRYLNLDAAGHAYRYVPPRQESARRGSYRAHRSLVTAVEHVGLWELPWMKPGLEAERCGLTWDERWLTIPDVD